MIDWHHVGILLVSIGLSIAAAVWTVRALSKGTRLARVADPNQVPWFRNAFGFAGMGAGLIVLGLSAEIALLLQGVEGGLPEAVTTPLFSFASALAGYAGGCIEARKAAPPASTTDSTTA